MAEREILQRQIITRDDVDSTVKDSIQAYNETLEKDTDDTLPPELEKLTFNQVSLTSDEAFFEWLKEQIDYMEEKLMFVGEVLPNVYELDFALMRWPSVNDHLASLYAGAERSYETALKRRDAFYNCKYMEVRNTYNTIDVKKAQWLSATELSATVYSKYESEFAWLDADLVDTKCRLSTIKNLQKLYTQNLEGEPKNEETDYCGCDCLRGHDFPGGGCRLELRRCNRLQGGRLLDLRPRDERS